MIYCNHASFYHFHQAYFSETTYYKSMLESKNKVYQKVAKTGSKYMDIREVESTMVQLNRRFQECISSAKVSVTRGFILIIAYSKCILNVLYIVVLLLLL